MEEQDFIIKLEEALLGDDSDYKISLLKGLAQFEVTPYAETVTQLLYRLQQFEEDPKVLALMLRNLGLYQFKDSSDFLLEYLKHPHVDVRAAALKSLAYYNDSRLLITFMELFNEPWKSDRQLKLIDEIIDFVFAKRPDLGLAAIEKLGKKGRSQEERLKNWLSYCQSSSWPTIQIIYTWYDYEFSENFLDFITDLICQLLTNWNLDDIAPLLLKNPHQKYKNQFIKTLKELKPSFDPSDYGIRKSYKKIKTKNSESESHTPQNIIAENSSDLSTETDNDHAMVSTPAKIEEITDEPLVNRISECQSTQVIQEEDLIESAYQDDSENITTASTVETKHKKSKITDKQNESLSITKFIPYLISVMTGGLATVSLYMLIVSLPTDSHELNNRLKSTSLTLQNLPSENAIFSDKVTFLGQKSTNLALFNWNGYSLVAKLSSPQWLPFDINDFVRLNGSFQGKDKLGNLILNLNSFTK